MKYVLTNSNDYFALLGRWHLGEMLIRLAVRIPKYPPLTQS